MKKEVKISCSDHDPTYETAKQLMQPRRLLYWCGRSIVCRAAVIGGLTGASLSLGIVLLGIATAPHDPLDLISALWLLIFTSPAWVLRMLGLRTWSSRFGTSWAGIMSVVTMNMLLFSLLER